jgi:hypothetical protein
MIEAIIKVNLPYAMEAIKVGFPMESISNLVPMPFARYAFQEIQDYVKMSSILIALLWTAAFNAIAYWRLKVSDI